MHKGDNRKAFTAPLEWNISILQQPAFYALEKLFPELTGQQQFPSQEQLTSWYKQKHPESDISFVLSEILDADGRYYEEFIFVTKQVPTRTNNWHDFFGAIIWSMFPKSKTALNHRHMAEILQFGLKQRSPIRHKLTLFDECGVLVLYSRDSANLVTQLQDHQWTQVFWEHRSDWLSGQQNSQKISALMFGHANYEMLTKPFIGLTGKMWPLQVPDEFFHQPMQQQWEIIDDKLSEQITNFSLEQFAAQLSPLPLLGVPGWWPPNEQLEFYEQHKQYFRAKSQKPINP
jgi:hypothetical protein